jgi:ABC-type Fe3+ transport system permease subunit
VNEQPGLESATEPTVTQAPETRPEPAPAGRSRIGRWWWAVGIAIAALIVVVLASLASSDPDGLERVAEDQGFIEKAENFFAGLFGDYAIPGVDDPALTTILSGLLGVAIVVLAMVVLGRLVVRRRA